MRTAWRLRIIIITVIFLPMKQAGFEYSLEVTYYHYYCNISTYEGGRL